MKTSIHYRDENVVNILTETIRQHIEGHKQIKIVCIGTDRSTGDALGPLVGSRLAAKGFDALGTLDNPVHAQNLQDCIDAINRDQNNPFIIAVDAALGRTENIGYINVKDEPSRPGSGVNKDLPEIGDISIEGIVNLGGFRECMVLQNTRLSQVMKQADIIAAALEAAVSREEV